MHVGPSRYTSLVMFAVAEVHLAQPGAVDSTCWTFKTVKRKVATNPQTNLHHILGYDIFFFAGE